MGAISRVVTMIVGRPIELPEEMKLRYPDLAQANYRRGGLPVRIGGWALGTSTADAITLGKMIFIGQNTPLSAALLLHELRHVHQFLERKTFPVSYLWQSLRHGYTGNAYEVDARNYSARRLAQEGSGKDL
jgi:hypothetical protein